MNLSPIIPEIIILGGACLLLLLSILPLSNRRLTLGIFSLLIPITSLIALLKSKSYQSGISDLLLQDPFSFFCRILLLVIVTFVLFASLEMFTNRSKRQGEFLTLLLFSVGGLMLMTQATHMLTLYLAIETSSIPLYMIAGLKLHDPKSKEAIVKYYLLGAFASAMLIYGVALIFSATDQLSFTQIARMVRLEPVVLVGTIMILAGLAFKIAAFPFHFWAPDVYEGAPPISTAIISVGPKIAALVAMTRFVTMGIGSPFIPIVIIILISFSALSMTFGNFSAIWQTEVKRIMAYSSIAQVGYMLLSVVVILIGTEVGNATASNAAMKGLLFYITSYSFANIGVFSLIKTIEKIKGGTILEDFKGLAKTHPVIAAPMAILLLSLLGLPILSGFFGKLLIFSSLVQINYFWLLILAILNSVVSAYYYLGIIKAMFFEKKESFSIQDNLPTNSAFLTGVTCSIITIFLGLLPWIYQAVDWVVLKR
jgi:NADH-quinone oxidoreductase subunit N